MIIWAGNYYVWHIITVLHACVKAISTLSASFCASPILHLKFKVIYLYIIKKYHIANDHNIISVCSCVMWQITTLKSQLVKTIARAKHGSHTSKFFPITIYYSNTM